LVLVNPSTQDSVPKENEFGQIEKIAIVADPKWEIETLAFAGAGFRRAPVKFFSANQLALARAWLG
jgi:hypothetical protein